MFPFTVTKTTDGRWAAQCPHNQIFGTHRTQEAAADQANHLNKSGVSPYVYEGICPQHAGTS